METEILTTSVSRRTFLKSTWVASTVGTLACWKQVCAKPATYTGLNTNRYLGEFKVETVVNDQSVFTEGPAVSRNGDVFFTNIPVSKILRWSPKLKHCSVYRDDSHATNGLMFEPDGQLLCCEGGRGRITRRNLETNTTEVVVDSFNGFPLAPPNDLCLDGRGHLFFTSRPGTNDPTKGNPNAVYRVDLSSELGAGSKVHQLLRWPDVHMPNGIVTSPDEKTLYLIEAHPDADHHRDIRAFDLNDDGEISNERVLIDFYPGRSGDGMCIDYDGNLYAAAGLHKTRQTSETLDTRPGIHIISPDGKLKGYRETPEDTVTNCTFGGKDLRTLYVTCGTKLLSVRTDIPGKLSNHR